jgi:hypothetical protein
LAPRDGRQGEPAVGQGVDQAVGHQAIERAGALSSVWPRDIQVLLADGRSGFAKQGQQATAALPVRSRIPLAGPSLG